MEYVGELISRIVAFVTSVQIAIFVLVDDKEGGDEGCRREQQARTTHSQNRFY